MINFAAMKAGVIVVAALMAVPGGARAGWGGADALDDALQLAPWAAVAALNVPALVGGVLALNALLGAWFALDGEVAT